MNNENFITFDSGFQQNWKECPFMKNYDIDQVLEWFDMEDSDVNNAKIEFVDIDELLDSYEQGEQNCHS